MNEAEIKSNRAAAALMEAGFPDHARMKMDVILWRTAGVWPRWMGRQPVPRVRRLGVKITRRDIFK